MQKKLIVAIAGGDFSSVAVSGFIFAEPQSQPSQPQSTLQNIIIRPDGSISPAEVPIQRNGDVYTFTDNIYGTIKIQRSNIVLDGAGYTFLDHTMAHRQTCGLSATDPTSHQT